MTTPQKATDQWIRLKPPEDVFKSMVPRTVRYDEKFILLPDAQTLSACYDGDDHRTALKNTLASPARWICKLQVASRDPATSKLTYSEGSGLLIGDRFVLTAAHVVMDAVTNAQGRFVRAIDASAIVVIPGLDGRGRGRTGRSGDTMPFGWVRADAFRTNTIFRKKMQKDGGQLAHLDYAVVRLAAAIGSKRFKSLRGGVFGYWGAPSQRGRTRIRVVAPNKLRNVKVNAVGYPGDKCLDTPARGPLSEKQLQACRPADRGSVPWYSFDRIRSAGAAPAIFSILTLDHDVAPSMSGGPVWLRWKAVRNLIGINHSCTRSATGSISSVTATRITAEVKRDLQKWIV